MILETLVVGPLQVNCYILASSSQSQAVIIDPGSEKSKIQKRLDAHGLKPACIINTHGHIDHIGCDDDFGVPVYAHTADVPLLTNPELNLSNFLASQYAVKAEIRTLVDNSVITCGDIELQVIHTPGHTPGGISLYVRRPRDKVLFTGDSLFYRSVGRSDFPGADGALLLRSIREKLFVFPDDTVVLPGHGPASTIGEEKRENEFLRDE